MAASPSFDFDHVPERRGTDSQKWQKYAGRDILPMWVADMDFAAPPAVIAALQRRVEHGVFGYARPVASTVEAVLAHLQTRYQWTIDPSWIVWLPGMVSGLNLCALAYAAEQEEVLTLTPVYPPFLNPGRAHGRQTLRVPWAAEAGRWVVDWDALEAAVTPRTRLFFLCHPHNPIGRVWRREELLRLGEFCARHNLILVSDEIHCDLVLADLPHLPSASLDPALAARTVTLMAPSKTYNIPGLACTLAIIADDQLRARFHRAGLGLMPEVTPLGYAACEAAYSESEPWRQALLAVLRRNRDAVAATVADLPGVSIDAPMEATYLAWLNVSELELSQPAEHFEAHGLGLSDGNFFGAPLNSHLRLNYGCPPAVLDEGLRRLQAGVRALRG